MIDSLIWFLPLAELHELNGLPERFALVTLHRPSNVDDGLVLGGILKSLLDISERLPVASMCNRLFICWNRCRILNSWLLNGVPWRSLGLGWSSGRNYLFESALHYLAR